MSAPLDLKSKVGEVSSERSATVSEAEMRAFADSVRATLGNTAHSMIVSTAAPTVFTLFRQGEFELLGRFGIELKQVLHAEQEYRYDSPLACGEEIRYATTLAGVVEKKAKGARLAFMAFETTFTRVADASPVAFARSTIVFREPGERSK
jgi:acyl dehydratase